MNVAGLSSHSNLEKAHEVSNECKRLNKALKEGQEFANIYNNRERLFGIAVTNVNISIIIRLKLFISFQLSG